VNWKAGDLVGVVGALGALFGTGEWLVGDFLFEITGLNTSDDDDDDDDEDLLVALLLLLLLVVMVVMVVLVVLLVKLILFYYVLYSHSVICIIERSGLSLVW
jgi:heme/copper-type cytochrome/quinol oxidase subunit 2